ncbi:MAG: carboxymuconolactone decarboxylase family protein [Proteobacteria bacterium]|nr:carboxymuconolactone decarboxylase family protein [Pseudomonadota bacterium]
MPRIAPAAHPAPEAQALLDGVKAKIGMVPNLYATLAHAPVALESFLQSGDTLGRGRLSAKERELVALAAAELNSCAYCLSAHTAIAKGAGLSAEAIAQARLGQPSEARAAAIVNLTRAIVREQGKLSQADLAAAFAGGLTEGDLVEVLAVTVRNIFTNYANHIFDTMIDFPAVTPGKAA